MVHELQTDMVPYIDGSDVEDEEYADAIRFGDKSISDKISQPARNFLITILHHNRYERPNAEECLRLPFLQNYSINDKTKYAIILLIKFLIHELEEMTILLSS